jgi:hypothetical protein
MKTTLSRLDAMEAALPTMNKPGRPQLRTSLVPFIEKTLNPIRDCSG